MTDIPERPETPPILTVMRQVIFYDLLGFLPDEEKKSYLLHAYALGKLTKADLDFWFQVFDLHGV